MSVVKKINVPKLVDRLGQIKADIAKLEAQEKEVIEELKALGAGVRIGGLFEANIFEQNRSTTSWKDVVEEAKVPAHIITKYTKSTDILVCKVTARK